MRDLVEFLARALVEDPDAVEVTEVTENGDLVVEVTVSGDDLGRLIGKGGPGRECDPNRRQGRLHRGRPRVLVEFIED
jgi:hypothetical protein